MKLFRKCIRVEKKLGNTNSMITQFQGEDRREAIVNHFSLDIEEEEDFFNYIESMGYTIDSNDEIIESLHKMFTDNKDS